MTWPAATLIPSRTEVSSTTPDTFDLTVACSCGASAPDSGRSRRTSRASTAATSPAASSYTSTLGASLPGPAAAPAFDFCMAAQPPAASSTISRAAAGFFQRRWRVVGWACASGRVSIFMAGFFAF